jgi:hypothetical protein
MKRTNFTTEAEILLKDYSQQILKDEIFESTKNSSIDYIGDSYAQLSRAINVKDLTNFCEKFFLEFSHPFGETLNNAEIINLYKL